MKNRSVSRHVASRRDFLKAKSSPSIIASLMVQARPEHIPALTPELNAIEGVEVHASADTGRMVLTIEAMDDQHFMGLFDAVQGQKHVINAQLVYHQIEDI
ncbi:MAG: chaperone NapD [Rhodospirillales bacterium]|nr:chaperone NapD [Rhodospirillales bacterium]